MPLPLKTRMLLVPQWIYPSLFNVKEIHELPQTVLKTLKQYLRVGAGLNPMVGYPSGALFSTRLRARSLAVVGHHVRDTEGGVPPQTRLWFLFSRQ